ncbi:MAG: exopolysaccharide biosynthesis protein [Bacteroidetes bacterium]|nr:MAG: exopolysaccharide biosynthesis protein [Bacteroidota bacterium]
MSENKLSEIRDFDSTSLGMFLFTWRKHLIIISLAAAILAVVFSSSYFITPLYKSSVVLFPVSSNSVSKALLSDQTPAKSDILEFGEDEQTEQMLQILSSSVIRDKVVQKFNLMEHYGINPSSDYKYTSLFKEYESNITFRRTEFMAVKITVLDRDPQMAADIANTISELLDSTKNAMQRERAVKGFKIVEQEYNRLQTEINVKEDSLKKIREAGVFDYESQSEMINQQLAIEIAHGNSRGIKALEDRLEVLAEYGGAYVSLRDQLEHEKKQLSYLKARFEEAKVDAEENLPQKFVVESAFKAEKKTYPVRWIIVLVATLAAFFISVLIIISIEKFAKPGTLKKKLLFQRKEESISA